jgi:hypothetical protein
VEASQESGDDVLAPPPTDWTGAGGSGDAGGVEVDANSVRFRGATHDIRLHDVTPSHDGEDGTTPLVVLAALE